MRVKILFPSGNGVDVDRKGNAMLRSGGLQEIHWMGSKTEEVHGRSQDGWRLKTSLGWGYM
jgi:hypothetical protein